MKHNPQVTAIVITYAPDADLLGACLKSLREQSVPCTVIVADNLSPSDQEHRTVCSLKPAMDELVMFRRNWGFGGAINRILPLVKTPYVLISNFDIVYDPAYLVSAVSALQSRGRETVGIAGKTLFYPREGDGEWPGRGPDDPPPATGRGTGAVIDNTGTLVNGLMLAYNRGVGQIDIGQYDSPDRPMGACFAAFLARRDAFRPISEGGVGLLDSGYFMYYEDIDWCYRANILGFRIAYEPSAVAWHHHSITTRDKPLSFKYHLIQRNLYRTIIKNMRFRTFVKLWLLHARLHIRRAKIEPVFGPVTKQILRETLAWMPVGLWRRIPIQLARKVSDTDIVNLSIGEESHLDDIALRPKPDWRNIRASVERLARLFPDDPATALLEPVRRLSEGRGSQDDAEAVRRIAGETCPALSRLIEKAAATEQLNTQASA